MIFFVSNVILSKFQLKWKIFEELIFQNWSWILVKRERKKNKMGEKKEAIIIPGKNRQYLAATTGV